MGKEVLTVVVLGAGLGGNSVRNQRTILRGLVDRRERYSPVEGANFGKGISMNIDRAVFAFAGVVVLAGLVLSLLHSQWWLLLTAFAGFNMFQAAFTGFCPAARLFRMLGLKAGISFS